MKKHIYIFCLLITTIPFAYSMPQVFNKNLTTAEHKKLENGETVIKKLKSVKDFSLSSNNENAQKALKTAKDLKPSYLAEIIQIYPYTGNEDFIQKFSKQILDIPAYAAIPYYSERNDTWNDLYSNAIITSSTNLDKNNKLITANLEMNPFGVINTQINTTETQDSFYYVSTNQNPLKYDGITCVGTKKMKCIVTIFKEGDSWILYGIGAVNAPSVFFLRERIELAFINRIKTFCAFFFKNL